ncbi:MAG: alkaline phosphatase family protein [Candidatus Eisenbacteria bacterium]|nr:alkaline phosphatase family protein [Candidatus Eisenbacteria bacterium]
MTPTFFKRRKKRACVIGLDGVPYTVLQGMMDSGVMPKTKEIISRGRIKPMTVTLPEISSVSWSTFMTGKDPGGHGIFGFTDFKDSSYAIRYPSFNDLKSPTIWDILGTHGMKSVVINQPSTYPARPIPGVLISGFVALELEKAVTPFGYYSALKKKNYQIDIDTQKCRDNPAELFHSLSTLLAARREVVDDLWEKEPWNLMEIVVTGTDRLHHFIWDAYEDSHHPHHEDFLTYYRKIDDFIHYISLKFQGMDGSGNLFILSDHGFCGTRKEVYINTVLQNQGFLHLAPGASSLDGVSENTRAFALDPARIYLNRKGRFPRGSVEKEDVEPMLRDITTVFDGLVLGGEKIVRRIVRNEDAYSGQWSQNGPDLLLVPENGFDLKGLVGAKDPLGERRLQGMHTWDNAFFFSLDKSLLEDGRELNIVDVPGKILRSLGVEI